MPDINQHSRALSKVLTILNQDMPEQQNSLAATIGLYGLRVLAASPRHFGHQFGHQKVTSFARRWNALKRKMTGVGASVQEELIHAGHALDVEVLRHHPDYRGFRDDRLTQAILILDKLEAKIDLLEDAWVLVQSLHDFLFARVRNQPYTALPISTPWYFNTIGAELLETNLPSGSCTIYDPACGVGGSLVSLYIRVLLKVERSDEIAVYGQDVSKEAAFIAAWRLIFASARHIHLKVGDTLKEPRFLDGGALKQFNLVITQPPVHYVADEDFGAQDPYGRFRYGAVQSNRADFAFVQHVVASLLPEGRAAVVMPVSALSRSGFEEEIRAGLVHADILSATASFQGGLTISRQTPAAVLFFDLAKRWEWRDSVFFVDAPIDFSPPHGEVSRSDLDTFEAVSDLVWARREELGLSKTVGQNEIKARHYNLAPQAYVQRQGPKQIEVEAIDQEISEAARGFQEEQETFYKMISALKEGRHISVAKKATE